MSTRACRYCGSSIVVLTCFDGLPRSFNAVAVTDQDTEPHLRWYVHRTRGAISGAVADAPAGREYLVLHFCNEYALTPDGVDVAERGGILGRPGLKFTSWIDLTGSGHRFLYRWPGSWAHIVRQDRGLCGARVTYPVTDDLKFQVINEGKGMPVCPDCLSLFEYRRRRVS